MTSDDELLRRYLESRNDDSFGELVQRHLDLVYSAALRQVNGDAHLAEDVTQTVFTDLARKAGALSDRTSVAGWLYTSAHFAAAKAVRTERRRRSREHEAHAMQALQPDPEPDPDWHKLQPLIDEAMHQLKDGDREAILLRYFENLRLADVGARLNLSENAARMRVDRAVEKLRLLISRRGVTTAVALSSVLSVSAVKAAPAGLLASLTSASLAGAATGAGGALTLINLMNTTKATLAILTGILAIGAAVPLLIQHRAGMKLEDENRSLRQQVEELTSWKAANAQLSNPAVHSKAQPTLRLPLPLMPATVPSPEPPADDLASSNRISQMIHGDEWPKLTPAQVEAYLKQNHRNAASLLAIFRANGDEKLLDEALKEYPNDPQVNFAAAFRKDATPEERRARLDALKQSAPDNALANYLSAINDLKLGQSDQAVQELSAAGGKAGFDDYSAQFVQNAEEAYRIAGYPESEAKVIAATSLLLPQLIEFKQFSRDAVVLASSYRQSGDETSAQAALEIAEGLGRRLDAGAPGGYTILNNMVGNAIQRIALAAMDPASPYGNNGQTVKDHMAELMQQRDSLNTLAKQVATLFPTMSSQDWISFQDRQRVFGEPAAAHWLINKYGGK